MEEEDNALWKHRRLDHGGEKVEFSMNSLKPRDLFSKTKFSATETFFRDQILRNRNLAKIGKSLESEKF